MYRRYEDPMALDGRLVRARQELEELKARLSTMDEDDPKYDFRIDDMIDLEIEIGDLEERINFAWQDDEYDELNASDSWENFVSCFE